MNKPTNSSNQERAIKILDTLQRATAQMVPTATTSIVDEYGRDPYLVLISCILSLRTKDSVSLPASRRLFSCAKTPAEMLTLALSKIEEIIKPVGFYRVKSKNILAISKKILDEFEGKLPADEDMLLSLPGVGRKTMNLVQAEGFELPAICVDTHVHRIANRLGIIQTKTPHETELALKKLLPKNRWRECNRLFVIWGQNICLPTRPRCSECAIFDYCQRIGVKKSR